MRAGYLELIIGELRESALQYEAADKVTVATDKASAERATAPDAVVVCGYGEMGQGMCDVLADNEGVGGGEGEALAAARHAAEQDAQQRLEIWGDVGRCREM